MDVDKQGDSQGQALGQAEGQVRKGILKVTKLNSPYNRKKRSVLYLPSVQRLHRIRCHISLSYKTE